MRHLTPEDAEAIRKVMFGWEKHLKTKKPDSVGLDQTLLDLKNVTEVVRRDPTLYPESNIPSTQAGHCDVRTRHIKAVSHLASLIL